MKYLLAIGLLATLCSNAAAVVINSDAGVPGTEEGKFGHYDKLMHTDRGSKSGGPLIVVAPSTSPTPVQVQTPPPAPTETTNFTTAGHHSQPAGGPPPLQPPPNFELPPQSNGKPPFLPELPIDGPIWPEPGDSSEETVLTVPEPGTLVLLAAGLFGLGLLRRKFS